MIFVYSPILLIFLGWIYQTELNIFLCILMTPISYLALNGGLIYYNHFNNVHYIIDQTIVIPFIENLLKNIVYFIIGLIFKISYIQKFYTWVKIKLLMSSVSMAVNYSTKSSPEPVKDVLTTNLENDYMEILKRNRKVVVEKEE